MSDVRFGNQIASLKVTFTLRDLKPLQELGHMPSDFTNTNTGNQEPKFGGRLGYHGIDYNSGEGNQGPLMGLTGNVRMGLSLPINEKPGAPWETFVYGATDGDGFPELDAHDSHGGGFGNVYSRARRIRAAYGPPQKDFANYKLAAPSVGSVFLSGQNPTSLPFIVGQAPAGTDANDCYVPSHDIAFPANISQGERDKTFYLTNNIWDWQMNDGQWGSNIGSYKYDQGPEISNANMIGGYLNQTIDEKGSYSVGFCSEATSIFIRKYDDQYFYIPDKTTWYFCGKGYLARYYAALAGIPDPTLNNPQKLPSQVWLNQRMSLFSVTTAYDIKPLEGNNRTDVFGDIPYVGGTGSVKGVAREVSDMQFDHIDHGINASFILSLNLQPSMTTNTFRDGAPSMCIIIGDRVAVDSGGRILGAQVDIVLGRPPTIRFPVRQTNASKYFHAANMYGGTKEDQGVLHIKTTPDPFEAIGIKGAPFKLTFEGFGDIGIIRLSGGGMKGTLEQVIGPQVAVTNASTGGLRDKPDATTSSYCAIKGKFNMSATNMNGFFNAGPICYSSWYADALMFKYHRFDLSSSPVLEKLVKDITPMAEAETGFGFSDLNSGAGNGLSMPVERYKFPDSISDPRGFPCAGLSVLKDGPNGQYSGTAWTDITPIKDKGTGYSELLDKKSTFTFTDAAMDWGVNQLKYRGILYSMQFPDKAYLNRTGYNAIAMWAHPYKNTQLLTVWPSVNHRNYIDLMHKHTQKLPSDVGGKGKPNAHTARDVSSFHITSKMDGCVVSRDGSITIDNPEPELISFLQQNGATVGSKAWINLWAETEDGQRINFEGMVTETSMNRVVSGGKLRVVFKDPLSLMLKKLEYPGEHSVNGWLVNDAINYVLVRLGLPLDPQTIQNRVTGVGCSVVQSQPLARLGRWIVTDNTTTAISFSGGQMMKKNLSTALGTLPVYQYPAFYWSSNKTVCYRDAFDMQSTPLNWGYDSNQNSMLSSDYKYYYVNFMPMVADSYNVTFTNEETPYQTTVISKDRFTGIPIWQVVGIEYSDNIAGFRAEKKYNYESRLTDASDIAFIKNQWVKQKSQYSPIDFRFKILGLLPQDINDKGGAGFTFGVNNIPWTMIKSSKVYLDHSDVSWNANDGNVVQTELGFKLIKPPLQMVESLQGA